MRLELTAPPIKGTRPELAILRPGPWPARAVLAVASHPPPIDPLGRATLEAEVALCFELGHAATYVPLDLPEGALPGSRLYFQLSISDLYGAVAVETSEVLELIIGD